MCSIVGSTAPPFGGVQRASLGSGVPLTSPVSSSERLAGSVPSMRLHESCEEVEGGWAASQDFK